MVIQSVFLRFFLLNYVFILELSGTQRSSFFII